MNREVIYEKVLKYLSILKQGKTIKTAPQLRFKADYGAIK